ncbi:unnamed protein product [Pleuronectes platessa]|uniref:Uncharacterized protein n=1 Tax=Pleuronectes platessa TaxID=8262 RepID=A0A9N7VKW9_PLEPL|nr:unnamed protein product [Pleuronectes platessa]
MVECRECHYEVVYSPGQMLHWRPNYGAADLLCPLRQKAELQSCWTIMLQTEEHGEQQASRGQQSVLIDLLLGCSGLHTPVCCLLVVQKAEELLSNNIFL